jgi:crotonobetainyl-CoA:carnitine CoA-transferase CaiB-like acyl-CoA transferase
MWITFCRAIGDTGTLAGDERFSTNSARMAHRDLLIRAIEVLTGQLTTAELMQALGTAGIPASAVRSVVDLADDPQLDVLGLWGATDEGFDLVRFPVGRPGDTLGAAGGSPGQTHQILSELGMTPAEIEHLHATGVAAELSAPEPGQTDHGDNQSATR